MSRKGDVALTPQIAFTGTKATITAWAGAIVGMEAIATDTSEKGVYDGADWQWSPISGGGGGSGVASVSGDGVDNTDPDNPVISYPTPADIGAEEIANKVTSVTDASTDTQYPSAKLLYDQLELKSPIGIVQMYAGASAPTDFLMCDGASLLRSSYPVLFAVIGTSFGSVDGTHFNVPDLKGKFPVGKNSAETEFDTLGESGGAKDVVLTEGQLPEHTHIQNAHTHTQNAHNHTQDAHTHIQNAHTHVQNAHTHTQDAHNHSQNAHNHYMWGGRKYVTGLSSSSGTGSAPSSSGSSFDLYTGDQTATNNAATATNQNTTPTNQNTTPTNQNATATNQSTTPTNQNATATNQNTGDGEAHPNLPPYLVLNFIIRYQ